MPYYPPAPITPGLSKAPSGAIAESFPRGTGVTIATTAITSGTLRLVAIEIPSNKSISNISVLSGSTAATSPTAQWFALIDSAFNVLAKTADDTTTAWAANAVKTLAIASPFPTTYSGLYYVGILVVAATPPTLTSLNDGNAAINAIPPFISGNSTTGLTTPASLGATATALSVAVTSKFYAYLT